MKTRAVIAGSFDPITKGHLWVIREALDLFDSIEIAIATNPNKKTIFTALERYRIVRDSILSPEANIKEELHRRINVNLLDAQETTVSFAENVRATHIVRGIRNTTDFEYEHQIKLINSLINDKIGTVYVIPPRALIEVSSSTVKGLVGLRDWKRLISPYVTMNVIDEFGKKTGYIDNGI